MLNLFKYIVVLFLSFNISNAIASEVIFEPFDEPEAPQPTPSFTNASSLPHPVQMREIINDSSSSPLGKLFILARYFEARYPDNSLDLDFSEDISLIFPEMNADEVQKTMNYTKKAIRLYRLGKEKFENYQKEKLAPKDPPLIVSNDQYAIIGDTPYIETSNDEVAVISDFKKVISYGSNPREIEAYEAFYERMLTSKKDQTDFEHLRTMLSKVDWSQITSYGTTKPSPFVGNAGIGSWVEADSFRARLISDTARIGAKKSLILGLHIFVPNHRFILASNLPNDLNKPKIRITNAENVASYEIFEPLPVQVTSEQMIGAYRGDFAFPIKIELKEANKPLKFETEIAFENCDTDLDCAPLTLKPNIEINIDSQNQTIGSSMSNFIHQSLYNIPQTQNKYINLENISYTMGENNLVSKIDFVFKYRAKIKNFALFLENEDNTLFSSPTVVSDSDYIYAQVTPLENTENLLQKPLVLTARLNDYATLRQTLLLPDFKTPQIISSLKNLFFIGLISGLLFFITPFGFVFALPSFWVQNKRKLFVISKAVFTTVFLATFLIYANFNPNLVYFTLSDNFLYLSLVFIILASGFFAHNLSFLKQTKHPVFQGLTFACLMCLFIPVSHTPYLEKFVFQTMSAPLLLRFISLLGIVFGLTFPDLCALFFSKKKMPENGGILAQLFATFMLFIALLTTALWLFLSLTWASSLKIAILLFIGCFALKYIFHFWTAVYQTDLKPSYIRGTEKFLVFFVPLFALAVASFSNHLAEVKIKQNEQITFEQINEKVLNGENLIVALKSPNCLVCKYNDFFLFNAYNLKKFQKIYNLSYIPITNLSATQNTVEFLQKYKKLERPLYVFYTPLAPNGVVLPNLITLSDLTKTFENFNLYPSSSSIEELLEKSRNTPLR